MARMIQDFTATLTSKRELVSGVWYYHFSLPQGVTLNFIAGQYVILKIGDNFRQYSIASRDTWHDKFELLVEMIPQGIGSNFFYNLPVGGEAMFKGPAGVFTLKDTPKNKIFLATGTGVAPMRSMIESYFDKSQQETTLTLFFGVKNRTGVYLYDEFKEHTHTHPNFTFKTCLSREETTEGLDSEYYCLGRINAHLEDYLHTHGAADEYEYYICGSKQAVDSLKEYVITLGVPNENIFFERFTL